jgi:hypothetical protein
MTTTLIDPEKKFLIQGICGLRNRSWRDPGALDIVYSQGYSSTEDVLDRYIDYGNGPNEPLVLSVLTSNFYSSTEDVLDIVS